MAGEATGVVIFSLRSAFEELRGAASSRLWRPGFCCTLIEKHVPVWVVTPIGFAAHSQPKHLVLPCNNDISGPLEMDLMPTMASIFDQENRDLQDQAKHEEVIHFLDGAWWISPNTQRVFASIEEDFHQEGDGYSSCQTTFPSGKLYEMSFDVVSKMCRVSVMRMPNSVLLQDDSIVWMRSIGIDVDEFSLIVRGEQ